MPRGSKKVKLDNNLTMRQEAFCAHYAVSDNSTDAYRKSYDVSKSTNKTVGENASRLLAIPKIQSRIEFLKSRKIKAIEHEFDISVKSVTDGLAAIAFFDPADYYTWATEKVTRTRKDGTEYEVEVVVQRFKPSDQLTKRQRMAIQSVGMTVSKTGDMVMEMKHGDRKGALVEIGRHLGMFKDKVEHRHVVQEFADAAEASRQKLLALIDAAPVEDGKPPMRTVN